MRSLRLDPELDERVRRAAELEGMSVSAFLRAAATERAERTLGEADGEPLAGFVGAVHGGGGRARRTGAAFGELLAEQRATR